MVIFHRELLVYQRVGWQQIDVPTLGHRRLAAVETWMTFGRLLALRGWLEDLTSNFWGYRSEQSYD
jgi:hypothetical protein